MGAALFAWAGSAEAIPSAWFCDGPIWCDPIHRGVAYPTLGEQLVYVSNPDPLQGFIGVHARKGPPPLPAPLAVGYDAEGHAFFARLDGQAFPAGESVAYIASKSLGRVTRVAANGGMAHGVQIDDPALNGRPDAVLVVGRVATPGASTSALGVWYDGARWWIYNETVAPMAPGETFVYAEGTNLGGQAVHDAANDYQGIGLYLDDARINGNPAAVVIPQHAYTAGYNTSALGVWYDATRGQWVVYNESGSALAPGQTIHYVAVP